MTLRTHALALSATLALAGCNGSNEGSQTAARSRPTSNQAEQSDDRVVLECDLKGTSENQTRGDPLIKPPTPETDHAVYRFSPVTKSFEEWNEEKDAFRKYCANHLTCNADVTKSVITGEWKDSSSSGAISTSIQSSVRIDRTSGRITVRYNAVAADDHGLIHRGIHKLGGECKKGGVPRAQTHS